MGYALIISINISYLLYNLVIRDLLKVQAVGLSHFFLQAFSHNKLVDGTTDTPLWDISHLLLLISQKIVYLSSGDLSESWIPYPVSLSRYSYRLKELNPWPIDQASQATHVTVERDAMDYGGYTRICYTSTKAMASSAVSVVS